MKSYQERLNEIANKKKEKLELVQKECEKIDEAITRALENGQFSVNIQIWKSTKMFNELRQEIEKTFPHSVVIFEDEEQYVWQIIFPPSDVYELDKKREADLEIENLRKELEIKQKEVDNLTNKTESICKKVKRQNRERGEIVQAFLTKEQIFIWFLKERTEVTSNPKEWVTFDDIFEAYQNWILKLNISDRLKHNEFGKELQKYSLKTSIGNNRKRNLKFKA